MKEYERLILEAEKCIKNIEDVKSDMKDKGIIGFCKHCSFDIYADKLHECFNPHTKH